MAGVDTGAKDRRADFVMGGYEDAVMADTDAIANPNFRGKVQE